MTEILLILILVLIVVLAMTILLFSRSKQGRQDDQIPLFRQQIGEQEGRLSELQRSEARNLRQELGYHLETNRKELNEMMEKLRNFVQERMEQFSESQVRQGDRALVLLRESRQEVTHLLADRLDKIGQSQIALSEKISKALLEVRDGLMESLNRRMDELQTKNDEKLELMRKTVDEKLHQTLETRLSQSFEVVTRQLVEVQKGLVEMQTLAQDVGGLKKALTNIKVRGVFGEVQLGALLEQFLAPEQFVENTPVRPRGNERVEFAVKLPGSGKGETVLLPIDAKFPIEDYQRLVDAYEHGDKESIEQAGKALEQKITHQAQEIKNKYIAVPYTTEFALLFLPVEGLYAEVIRRGTLFVDVQQKCRVTIVGPTTLSAFLNSLQVGFKTLAISRQSSEVWRILGAVRTEFGRFGEVLQSVQKNLDHASSNLSKVSERSKQMEKKLKDVEVLPETQAGTMLSEPMVYDEVGK